MGACSSTSTALSSSSSSSSSSCSYGTRQIMRGETPSKEEENKELKRELSDITFALEGLENVILKITFVVVVVVVINVCGIGGAWNGRATGF